MRKFKHIVNLFLITSILIAIFSSCNKDFYSKNKYPPIKIISHNENRRVYKVEAVSGHVIALFNKTISHSQAVKDIKQLNGKIISQIVNSRYYLIDTGAGNESEFINQLKKHPNINYVYFNAVEYPRKIDPQTYVMDNFYISHGNEVKFALKECGLTTRINTYNVGIYGDEKGRMSWSEIDRDLISILGFHTKDTPAVINMSFGPGFIDDKIRYWTDKEITDEVKNNYINQYKEGLKHILALTSNYKDKDFVIVKSAGNEGLKQLDTEILNNLEKEMTVDEIKILNEHFLLVGAVDSREPKYSNDITKGKYNFLYGEVDISDLKKDNENLYGTSFAAPRVSCFISANVNKNNIKATEVLQIIKDITRKNPDKPITLENIEKEAKILAEAQKTKPKENKRVNSNENKTEKNSGKTNTNNNEFIIGANEWKTFTLNDGNTIRCSFASMGLGDLRLEVNNYAPYPINVYWSITADNITPVSGFGDANASGQNRSFYSFWRFKITGDNPRFYDAKIIIKKKEDNNLTQWYDDEGE